MGDSQVLPQFPNDSIKIMAESIGISMIGDDVAKELADDITFRLKVLLQDGHKFMNHGKRKRFSVSDFDNVLKLKNIEVHIPFRFASGGGRELYFLEDKEIEVNDLASVQLQRYPLQLSVKAHWLAIDGVQPAIPENPPPIDKDNLKKDAVDPAAKLTSPEAKDQKHIHGRGLKSVETVKVKQLATHELSAEQQLYYKEITEACVGSDESKRGEALHSLAYDPGLHQMVPRLCTFISEGVRVNVVQKNLALLIYLMRMAKALLDNQTLYLEKYLHELVPSIMTCIVSKQLCLKPDLDNHWALRDFAARLISQICKNYNTSTNGIQTRITRVFSRCLNIERTPLSSVYGAVAGLVELGPEVTKSFILSKLLAFSEKIELCMKSLSTFEKTAATQIKTLILKSIPSVLKTVRSPPDNLNDYNAEYGYLGPQLHMSVMKARQTPTTVSSSLNSNTIRALAPTGTARLLQQGGVTLGSRSMLINKGSVTQQSGPTKVLIMSSLPSTQSIGSLVSTSSNLSNQLVTSSHSSTSQVQQAKYVVLTGPNQIPIKTEIKEEAADVFPDENMDSS